MKKATEWVRLVSAAADLGLSYGTTLRLVLVRLIRGEQRSGKWYVDVESVRRYKEENRFPPGV